MTSTNEVSPSECQSGNTTSKSTKKDNFSREKSPLPSAPHLEIPLGNAFMNISSSKNIPSIPRNGTLRIAEPQPSNLVGLQMVSKRTVPTPMRTVPPSQVPILQDNQSHPRNTVQNLQGWTVVSYRDKKVSSL
jgi:hypothetical protein